MKDRRQRIHLGEGSRLPQGNLISSKDICPSVERLRWDTVMVEPFDDEEEEISSFSHRPRSSNHNTGDGRLLKPVGTLTLQQPVTTENALSSLESTPSPVEDQEDMLPGYRIEDLRDHLKGRMTWHLAVTAFAIVVGLSFPHGYNSGVLNPQDKFVKEFLNSTLTRRLSGPPSLELVELVWSVTVSIYLLGGMIGAFSFGWFADQLGRKRATYLIVYTGLAASLMLGVARLARSCELLIIGRFVIGLACGAGSGLSPMFLTEISPINIRGGMGALHQLAFTLGILTSQVLGLSQCLGSDTSWPILLSLTCVPSLLCLAILPFFPDSPRHLLVNCGDQQAAEAALVRFRGTGAPIGRRGIGAAILEMKLDQRQKQLEPAWTVCQVIQFRAFRTPLMLVVAVNVAQQLSGISAVFYYSRSLFLQAGIPSDNIQYAILATGVIYVVMTGVSVPLVDLSGRRPLLLFSLLGMFTSAAVMTLALKVQPYAHWMAYLCVICALSFILSYAIGLGCIPQFLGSEFFQQGPRPAAMAIAAMLNWLANLAVALSFPLLQRSAVSWVFLPNIGCLLVFFILLWYKLPESKDRSFAEIAQFFGINMALLQSRNATSLDNFPPPINADDARDNVGFVQSTLTLHSDVSNV